MASDRGSRHRSHKHKQQKADDSPDSDTDQSLTQGPIPIPNPNPSPSSPRGPSVLNQEMVEPKGKHYVQKGLHATCRKENLVSISDAAAMDPLKENNPSSHLESLGRNFIAPGVSLQSKGDRGVKASKGKDKEGRARISSQHADTILCNPIHVAREPEADRYSNSSPPQSARARSNAAELLSLKNIVSVLDQSSDQMNTLVMKPEKKRARRDNLLQMPKELGGALVKGNVRNPELEKEPGSQIVHYKGDSRDTERTSNNRKGDSRDVERSRDYRKEHWLEEQNQMESWKAGMHIDRKHKEGSHKVDNGQENWPKVCDKNRIANGNREDKELKDNRRKDVVCRLKEDTCKEEVQKYVKQRDAREPEGLCKEYQSRGGRYKDEKGNQVRFANLRDFAEQEMLKKNEVYSWRTGDKTSMKPRRIDKLEQRRETFKAVRWKGKGSSSKGDQGEEEILKYQKERLEKHNEVALAQAKSKYEKKREDKGQGIFSTQKEEQVIDRAADAHDRYEKKRRERQDNFKIRINITTQDGKGKFTTQPDGEDVDGLERHGRGRLGFEGSVMCIETISKYKKIKDISYKDEKYRDDWLIKEGGLKERGRREGRMGSKKRDASKERLWGGSFQWENGSSNKESKGAQKHARDEDERQRNSSGLEKLRDKRRKVCSGAGEFPDEVSRNTGEKDGRHMSVVRGQSDELLKQGTILDMQPKRKWNHEFAEPKGGMGHVSNKADGTSLRASRATSSQKQMNDPSTTAAFISSTARNQSNGSQNFDTLDTAIADRDRIRPRSKLTEELADLSNEDKPRQEKFVQRGKYEMNVFNQSSSGTRSSHEQNWLMADNAKEGKYYQEPRSSTQDCVDEKRRALSHKITLDHRSSVSPSHGHDELMRGSLSNTATLNKRKQTNITQGVGSSKTRWVDEGSMDRLEPQHQGAQLNQTATDGPSAMQMPSNRPSGYVAMVPPRPPSVDNLAAMHPLNMRLEGSNSRENGRYNRKVSGAYSRTSEIEGSGDIWGGFGMGSWNHQSQVPGPGPIHMLPGLGSSGLLGMDQQIYAPHIHGQYGIRLSADMGFRGAQFHMGDSVAGFPVHDPNFGPVVGWSRFPHGNEAHCPVETWERRGRHLDGGLDMYYQAIPGGGWERACKPWQRQEEDVSIIATPLHRESVCQVSIEDAACDPELHVEKVEAEEDDVPDTVGISSAYTVAKALSKASKIIKERMQTKLLYANISAELAGIDLYRAYLDVLPPSEAKQRKAGTEDHLVVPDAFVDEDLVYEVDAEAQDLLLDTDPMQLFLPPFSDSAYKNALRVFQQRPEQQGCVQKSVVGSFLLPRRSVIIKIPINGKGAVKGAHIVSSEQRLGLQMGTELELETEVDHSEAAEAKNNVMKMCIIEAQCDVDHATPISEVNDSSCDIELEAPLPLVPSPPVFPIGPRSPLPTDATPEVRRYLSRNDREDSQGHGVEDERGTRSFISCKQAVEGKLYRSGSL